MPPAKNGCVKLIYYADMIFCDDDQAQTQAVNEDILNKVVLFWLIFFFGCG